MAIAVEASTVINRPLAEVFAFVSDFENHPKWEKNFLEVERLSAGAEGVGTTYRCVFKFPGQKVTSTLEITEHVPGRRIAFRADKPAMARPVGAILFAADGDGTRVTMQPRPEMRGPMRIMAPLMSGYVRRNTADHLKNLKALLES
jgi:uncharacterized membrane protein